MPTQQEYWDAVRAKVCVKCVEGDKEGGCHIMRSERCTLKAYFPQTLDAVNAVYAPWISPYEEQLRDKVCKGACARQDASGACALREDVMCALDRYFPLVVQVIEETQFRRSPRAS